MEPLFSLVYTSTATQIFADDELEALLVASRERNHDAAITGLLIYREGRFVQFLEGAEREVRDLFGRIEMDRRHTLVRVLIDGHPDARAFGDWSMGYEPLKSPTTPLPEGFRDSYEDIEHAGSDDTVLRALQELSIWFRHRAHRDG